MGKSPAELLFRRVLNSKTPELMGLDDEDADTTDQGARDRDTQKKKANKDYVDKKFHARAVSYTHLTLPTKRIV